jgi:hypothetical protein
MDKADKRQDLIWWRVARSKSPVNAVSMEIIVWCGKRLAKNLLQQPAKQIHHKQVRGDPNSMACD